MPPHFASLTLTPATTPTRPSRSSDRDRALVGDDRQRRALLEPAAAGRADRAGNGCSISSTPSRSSSGQRARRASSGCQPVLASTRMRPVVDRPDRLEGREVRGATHLDLQRREVRGPPGPLRDDRRLVEPEREVRRRDVRRHAEHRATGAPATCRAGRGGRCRSRTSRRRGGRSPRSMRSRRPRLEARAGRVGLADRARAGAAGRRRSSRRSRRRTGPDSPRRCPTIARVTGRRGARR